MATTIETRPYGKTGERVTVVGLGGSPLNERSYADGVATVRRALELGVTYFDTSPGYGYGVSQAIYGEALQGRSEEYILATKLRGFKTIARYRSLEALRTQLEENLRVLRRDSVDTLQVHEADYPCWWSEGATGRVQPEDDFDFDNAPVMQVLREAKAEGLCRFIGITGNSVDSVAHVLRHVEVDTCLPAFNYDLIRRGTRRQALPVAVEKGVTLILGGAFHNGQLTEVHPEWLSSPPDSWTSEVLNRFERLYALQKDCGLSLVNMAVRFLMANPAVTTILIGAATPAEIEESVTAAQAAPLPADLHQALEELGIP